MLSVEKQIFIQQMFARGYILFSDAILLINKILTELNKLTNDPCPKIGVRDLKSIIKEINSAIKPEEIQLAITTCEVTGNKYLTLHSIGHNDITELQTTYNPLELAYWLPLMEEIIKSDTKSMNRIDCLNLVTKYQLQIKMEDAEKFLNKCVTRGYLALSNGLYYLGSKAICEFNKDLRTTYEDYTQICELCSELCCYGKSCINCNKLMHDYCLQAALSTNQECPLCHVQWGQFDFEQAQEQQEEEMERCENSIDSDEEVGRRQKSRSTRSSQRKRVH